VRGGVVEEVTHEGEVLSSNSNDVVKPVQASGWAHTKQATEDKKPIEPAKFKSSTDERFQALKIIEDLRASISSVEKSGDPTISVLQLSLLMLWKNFGVVLVTLKNHTKNQKILTLALILWLYHFKLLMV
jgi:hypothetical protein